jgi:hypothetical protein
MGGWSGQNGPFTVASPAQCQQQLHGAPFARCQCSAIAPPPGPPNTGATNQTPASQRGGAERQRDEEAALRRREEAEKQAAFERDRDNTVLRGDSTQWDDRGLRSVSPAEGIPALLELTPAEAIAHPQLAARREGAAKERQDLRTQVDSQRERCGAVEEDSPVDVSCTKAGAELDAAMTAHALTSAAYNDSVRAMRAAPRQKASGPVGPTGPTVALLAKDPTAARLSSARLAEVQTRIAHLQKAIALLSDRDNAEWSRQFRDLQDDIRETNREGMLLAIDATTLGLSEMARVSRARNLRVAQDVVKANFWADLLKERATLEAVAAKTDGQPHALVMKAIAQLDKLEQARRASNLADAASIARDALAMGPDLYERARVAFKDSDKANLLYGASCTLGEGAALFVQAGVKEAVLPVAVAAKAGEGYLLAKNRYEEHKMMRELEDRAYDRHQKQLELDRTLAELEAERARLEVAVRRAQ